MDDAERFARKAVAAGEPTDYLYERGLSHLELGEVLVNADRTGEGLDQFRIALDLFERKGVVVHVEALGAGDSRSRVSAWRPFR